MTMGMFDKPMGGTELMFEELRKRLPVDIWERVSIFNYLPHADFSSKTVYWNQLSYDQQAIESLKDPELVEKIDHFVFVSFWQSEMYRKMFNIPGYKTHVIKNACAGVGPKQPIDPENIRICYTSTPWRGLDILLRAWEINPPENCELHVFSSCQIYGPEFGKNDSMYEDLYLKCQELPGVVYRGSVPNQELREELPSFDILAYPNTFEETSCIAVIEALSAGLRVITSSLGALPETTEGYARIYPYLMDKEIHSTEFSRILIEEIENVRNGFDPAPQMDFYKPRWSWESRIQEWNSFLAEILKEK